MCGILGSLAMDVPDGRAGFEAALGLLSHRGPDDKGVFEADGVMLGHRRLSIIDLTRAGHQPMVDNESGSVICFNGEVYNYIELRAELEKIGYIFRTKTDTEVVLKAYIQWGEQCLQRFNGMWALAIWEPSRQRLFVARDRFGVKPFYYTSPGNGLAFASEPKALLSLLPGLRVVDHRALYDFMVRGELYTTQRSFYDGIQVLPPAHFGIYEKMSRSFTIKRYWSLPHTTIPVNAGDSYEEKFSDLFEDAVRVRLRSDVPVGVSLSGGLDSTAVLAAAQRHARGKMMCFTSVYGDDSRGEECWAKRAADPYGIQTIAVEANFDKWLAKMKKIVWHMDGPGYSPAVFPVWELMQRAKNEGVPVLLEGQGADESLGGYPQYSVLQFMSQLKMTVTALEYSAIKSTAHAWRGMVRTFTLHYTLLWLIREMFPWLIGIRRKHVGALSVLNQDYIDGAEEIERLEISSVNLPHMDSVTRRLWEDYTIKILPGLLHYGDSISMAHSVESRLPFMDYRIIEWIFSCDANVKIRNGETKWLLRRYLEKVGQHTIANRPDKLGYPTPVDQWLARDSGRVPKEILLDSGSRCAEFCSRKKIDSMIRLHCSGKSGVGNHLYRLISTEIWLRECLG